MEINDVLRFLDTAQNEAETISQSDLAKLKNFTIDFLKHLGTNNTAYRWRIQTALYLAELHCPGIHETYLINEFDVPKKAFLTEEESILLKLKEDKQESDRRILRLQLSYLYRLFGYYMTRMKKLAHLHQHHTLQEKLKREIQLIKERHLLHTGKTDHSLSWYQLLITRKFGKNYYLYALICGVGIVAFWHGVWGIFDILHLHPFVTTIMGVIILLFTGILLHEFVGMKQHDDS